MSSVTHSVRRRVAQATLRRLHLTTVLLLATFSLLTACNRADSDRTASGVASNTVHIDGSNGVMPLVRALAESYMQQHPDAKVTFGNGLGSRIRLDSLRAGRMDIALASHGLDTAALRTEGLPVHRIAVTPVLLGVHAASVSLAGLASAQLCDVLAGRVTSWRQLGDGRDLALALVVRPEDEVDMEVLRDRIACARTLAISPQARVVQETGDMALALESTEGAIGVTTATVVQQSAGVVRALALDGVMPSPTEVQNGRYALLRSSYFITRAQPGSAIDAFLAFVRSEEGRRVLVENGSVAPDTLE